MPLTARESAKAPTGALAQASATAPKTPREARRITSNADIGTSRCVPGARRAESPRRLFTSLAPLRKTPTGGLLFPAGAEGDRRLPGHDGTLEQQAVGAASAAFFALERCKQMAASG